MDNNMILSANKNVSLYCKNFITSILLILLYTYMLTI